MDIWAELLGERPLGIDDSFVALAGDDALVPLLRARIRQSCGLEREPEWITGTETIDELAGVLAREAVAGGDRDFPAGQAGAPTLFLYHGDTNGRGFYAVELARRLADTVSLCALAPLGFHDAPLREDIEDMAAACLQRIRARQPVGPYHIAGYCNGALVAYEVARRLTARGERVERLILIDPTLRNSAVWFLGAPVRALARRLGIPARRRLNTVRTVRDACCALQERWTELRARAARALTRLRTTGRLRGSSDQAGAPRPAAPAPRRVLSEAARSRQHARRRDFEEIVIAVRGYIPGRYEGHIDAIWAKDRLAERHYSAQWAWPRVAPDTSVTVVPGNHHTCLTTHVDALADAMRALLRPR
jgi:thioesterase domain-containing protein